MFYPTFQPTKYRRLFHKLIKHWTNWFIRCRDGENNALILFGSLRIFSYSSVLRAVIGYQCNRLSTYLQEKSLMANSAIWWVPDKFETIQQAINSPSVNSADRIIVRHSICNEHVATNKTVSLIGENHLATLIDGSGTGMVVNITANNAYFSGFTVKRWLWHLPF